MKVSRRNVLRWGTGVAIGAASVNAWSLEPRRLSFERVTVRIKDLPKAFEGYRIAFLTDVHYPRNIDREFIHESIRLGNAFDPHLYLLGGDFVDTKGVPSNPKLDGVFEPLSAPDGVFGVLGNHDWSIDGFEVAKEIERTSPIRLMSNEHVLLKRGGDTIALAGIEDLWRRQPDMEAALKGIPTEMPRLLLSHNPDTAEKYFGSEGVGESRRVDLQISGHTHGGEVQIPLLGPPHIPSEFGRKFEQGLVQGTLHRVYVSRGIASPRGVRFLCPPEITGITLVRA